MAKKIVNGWKPLNISAKHTIFDVWQGSVNASEICTVLLDQIRPKLKLKIQERGPFILLASPLLTLNTSPH